jgi:hypothetical protein
VAACGRGRDINGPAMPRPQLPSLPSCARVAAVTCPGLSARSFLSAVTARRAKRGDFSRRCPRLCRRLSAGRATAHETDEREKKEASDEKINERRES